MFIILIRFLLHFCFILLLFVIYYHHYHHHLGHYNLFNSNNIFHMKLGFQPAIFTLLLSWNTSTYRFTIIFLCLPFFILVLIILFQKISKMWRRFVCILPRKSTKKYKKISSSKKLTPSTPLLSPSSSSSSCSDRCSFDPSCLCSNLGNTNPNRNSNSKQSDSKWEQFDSKCKSNSSSNEDEDGIDPLMSFMDVSDSEKSTLFIRKLCLCGTIIIDFKEPNTKATAYQKDLKKLILMELKDFISSNNSSNSTPYSESEILAVCKMCSANLFRDLPPPHHLLGGLNWENEMVDIVDDHDVREQRYDPAWSHLKLVYELLLYFVTSSSLDAKVAKKYINYIFLLRLFDLFDSEDPRERECLKILTHRIYGKFIVHRPFIRKNICYIFHEYTLGIERHNGITELLEIIGSVIAGLALPLKTEFKLLLSRVLIPMHKPKTLGLYIQQLTNCMMQYISKEPKLACRVVSGMLKIWPKTNSRKEVMLLSELEDIIEAIEMGEFQKVMIPLFQRLRCCITSYNSQVAERAMLLWNNENFVKLVEVNRHEILPIIFPALEQNAQCHWSQVALNLTYDVRNIFLHMDIPLFNACNAHYAKEQENLSLTIKNKREEQHIENVLS